MSGPNILWIMTDEQRADSLGCYGSPWARTPCLDALAAGGLRFDAACTPSPVCVPARASVLTGLRACRLGVLQNNDVLSPGRARFLTTVFERSGYATASFGKHHYNCPGVAAFGTQGGTVLDERVGYMAFRDRIDEREAGVVYYPTEFRHWILAGRFPGRIEDTAEARNAELALAWLRARDRGRPFLLRLSFNAPHTPVVAPAPYDTIVDADAIDLPFDSADEVDLAAPIRENLVELAGAWRLTREQIRRARQAYFGRAAFVDRVISDFLERADAEGALGDTVIVFTSDHGCHLGDHGVFQKQTYYEASLRVPLIVSGPGIPRAAIRTPVTIGSLLPSCLALAGLRCPAPTDFPDLAETLRRGTEPVPEPVFSDLDFGVWDYRPGDRYVMVREGDWKLAVFRDPADPARLAPDDGLMLHHLGRDPGERHNLAAAPECRPVIERLLRRIDEQDVAMRETGR